MALQPSPNPSSHGGPSTAATASPSALRTHDVVSDRQPGCDSPPTPAWPPRAHLDLEKQADWPGSPTSETETTRPISTIRYSIGREDLPRAGDQTQAWRLLLYLAGPCFVLSLLTFVYSLLALVVALLLLPLSLLRSHAPGATHLHSLLAPPLRLHLRLAQERSRAAREPRAKFPHLVAILLLAPFVAVGVAVASWTAAFFWFFSAVLLGDSGGSDGPNDGRETLLGVGGWWVRWLRRGLH